MKLIILSVLLVTVSIHSIAQPNQKLPKDTTGPWVVKVYYDDIQQLREYAKTNVPWKVHAEQKYFTISVDNIHQYQTLFSYGFLVEVDTKQMNYQKANKSRIAKELKAMPSIKTIPGFSCERTVEETYATIDSLVASYPSLAVNIDVGNTWEKNHAGGQSNGYDIRVIKITNSAITGPKPILYITSSMHARELAPAELNTRFAEYLLNNYGVDADVTWIVDHREIHLLLQANPDGRKRAESPDTNKRKNQNNNYCAGNNTRGIDMNRNFPWMWNQGSGSSGVSCNQTFRGPSAGSELENQAIDSYLKQLFIDARGPNLADAAADDTTGIYIDIHSEASLILWPYGFDDPNAIPVAPNDTQLQTLGRKLAWYNGYYPEKSNELYGADGAADDNAYGQLGVAAFTFELGGDAQIFRPTCDYVDNTLVPDNLKALIYAAKVAKTPYITAAGPDIDNLTLSANNVASGTVITLTGLASDLHFNNANGTESTQNISTVQMFVDELPWDMNATALQLVASDGNFDSGSESFTGQIDTSGMLQGQHKIYLQSTDSDGVTGVPYAYFFDVVDPNLLGSLSGVIKDASTNNPIEGADVTVLNQHQSSDAFGQYNFSLLAGQYDLNVSQQGYENFTINNLNVSSQQTTQYNVVLQPICALINESTESFVTIADATTAGWIHGANQGVDDWSIDTNGGLNNSHGFSTTDAGVTTDKWLQSPQVNLTANSTLEFWHKYLFEGSSTFYDGAVLEISTNGGSSWQDLGSNITTAGYNATLANGNPLSGRSAWGGAQNNFIKVIVDLASYAGSTASIRWRFAADTSVGAGTWDIDDIRILDPIACITTPSDVIFKQGFE